MFSTDIVEHNDNLFCLACYSPNSFVKTVWLLNAKLSFGMILSHNYILTNKTENGMTLPLQLRTAQVILLKVCPSESLCNI